MPHGQSLLDAHYRVIQYYLDYLRAVQKAYLKGGESVAYALAMFDQEREQVKQWQAWIADRARQDARAAAICSDFARASPDIFNLRLHPQEYFSWLKVALEAARRLGDRRAEAEHLLGMSNADEQLGYIHHMLDSALQALEIARQINDRPLIALGSHLCGKAFLMQRKYEEAQASYEEGLVLYRTMSDRQGIAQVLRSLGTLALQRQNLSAAQDYLEQSLALYQMIGNQRGTAMCLSDLGFLAARREDYPVAQDALEQALALHRAIGDQRGMAETLSNLAAIAFSLGNVSYALNTVGQSLAIARNIGDQLIQGVDLLICGMVALEQDDLIGARGHYEQSLAISRSIEQRQLMLASLSNLASIYLQIHEEDLAYTALREGLELTGGFPAGMTHFTLHVVIAAAHMWLYKGRALQAAAWLGLLESRSDPIIKAELKSNVRRLRSACEAALPPEEFAAAWEQGKTLNLDAVVASILVEL